MLQFPHPWQRHSSLMEKTLGPPSEVRFHEIDGLRGIAILSVVVFHLVVYPLAHFFSDIGIRKVLSLLGYGVDLFFVISGFLIGRILLRIKTISGVKAFFLRRILRIWPLYYLLLFLVYLILPNKDMFSSTPIWSFFFFIFNIWESFGKEIHQALGPLWSIAVEEQFYILGPIIFFLFDKKKISYLLIAFLFLSPLLRLSLYLNSNVDLWRFTPTRIDGICIGLLLAMFLSSPKNIEFIEMRKKAFFFITVVLLLSLIPAISIFPGYIWVSFGHSLIVLTFGCVLLVTQVNNFYNRKIPILNWSFLRYFGIRCYSIYLFHTFCFFIAVAVSSQFYITLPIALALILLLAHFSWRYIEAPLIGFGRRFSYGSNLT